MDPGLPRVSDERDPNRSGFDRDLPRWDLGWDKGKSIVSGRPLPNVRESLPWKETSTTHGSIRMLGRARKRRIRGTETILDERGHGNAHDPRRKCEVDTGPCRRRERFLVRVGASFDVPITCTFGVDPVRSPPTVSPRHLLPLHPPKRQVRRVGKRLAKTDRTSLRSLGVGLGCGGVDDRWVVLPVPGQDVPIGSMGSFPSTGMLRWTRRGEGHDLRPDVREGRERRRVVGPPIQPVPHPATVDPGHVGSPRHERVLWSMLAEEEIRSHLTFPQETDKRWGF